MDRLSALRGAIWAPIALALVIQGALLFPQISQATSEKTSSEIVLQAANKAAAIMKDLPDTPEQQAAEEFGESVRKSKQASGEAGVSRENVAKLVLDGKRISDKRVDKLMSKVRDYTSKVEHIDQNEILPAGCEIVALAVSLRALGYKVEPEQIADDYLKMDGGKESYSGSPYEDGGGMPPSIVYAANAWLADHGKEVSSRIKAHDLTKTPFNALLDLAKLGYPVLVWVTDGMSEPWEAEDGSWYAPEHCVVLYGMKGGKVLVSDSLVGLVKRDKKQFSRIYKLCGKRAVALLPF